MKDKDVYFYIEIRYTLDFNINRYDITTNDTFKRTTDKTVTNNDYLYGLYYLIQLNCLNIQFKALNYNIEVIRND